VEFALLIETMSSRQGGATSSGIPLFAAAANSDRVADQQVVAIPHSGLLSVTHSRC